MELKAGQTAVVTGAASGIGLGLARSAAAAGMKVVLADVETEALEVAEDTLRADGATVLAVPTDVSSESAVRHLADAATERFGSVELLCNNAGVGAGGPMAELTREDWEWVLGVNLWGVIHGISAFLPAMVGAGRPAHIVNTASMAGHFAAAMMGPYAASKFAVVAISESLRAELAGSPVGVSVLCPGWVRTRIAESGRNRPGRPVPPPSGPESLVAGMVESGLDPGDVGRLTLDAVRRDQFWVFTHPEMVESLAQRFEEMTHAARSPQP